MKVAQLCLTLWDPTDYTVHRILQARVLEWGAFPFSRGSSQPRDWTQFPALQADSLPAEPPGKPKNTEMGSLCLLQQIFLTHVTEKRTQQGPIYVKIKKKDRHKHMLRLSSEKTGHAEKGWWAGESGEVWGRICSNEFFTLPSFQNMLNTKEGRNKCIQYLEAKLSLLTHWLLKGYYKMVPVFHE